MSRGTSNSNARGNTRDRASRKRYLLRVYEARQPIVRAPYPGLCRCYACGTLLTFSTVTVDRIVPGCRGGRYVRGNIRPACAKCNSETGGRLRK